MAQVWIDDNSPRVSRPTRLAAFVNGAVNFALTLLWVSIVGFWLATDTDTVNRWLASLLGR